ncbi:MAG: hypothetical protein DI551_06885 [Micavibrio aeruginosavorus]|uniref:Glycosyl transferase family 1 n=1 Tax=Micavibrio aeruginosavorus TaxID=349221 RepID=A0A2W5MZ34_9BACT|nr:MAG: hypothetical protein DI551_06885 [Micavibrio aeruginosavorus]
MTQKPMKILHVVRQYDPAIGGLESYVKSMAAHQKSMGHAPEILTLNQVFHGDGVALPDQSVIDGISVKRVGFWGRRRFFIPKISPLFFTKYDIVHVHNTDMFYDYAAWIGILTKTPCFATTHGGFFHTKDFSLIKDIYFNVITRISSLGYKTIFAISQNDMDTFKKLNKNIVLQPNAIEPLGTEISNGKDFLYIGRLAEHKHVERVIEVFSHLKTKHGVQGSLHIIGPAWDVTIEELQKKAADLGITDAVSFHGAADRNTMKQIAMRCGYFLSASTFEGFGMSMLEAMTVGIIPFVEGNESFSELIAQSGVGLCLNCADAEKAASEIAARLPAVDDAQRIKARDFAAGFSWDELARGTLSAYEKATA